MRSEVSPLSLSSRKSLLSANSTLSLLKWIIYFYLSIQYLMKIAFRNLLLVEQLIASQSFNMTNVCRFENFQKKLKTLFSTKQRKTIYHGWKSLMHCCFKILLMNHLVSSFPLKPIAFLLLLARGAMVANIFAIVAVVYCIVYVGIWFVYIETRFRVAVTHNRRCYTHANAFIFYILHFFLSLHCNFYCNINSVMISSINVWQFI